MSEPIPSSSPAEVTGSATTKKARKRGGRRWRRVMARVLGGGVLFLVVALVIFNAWKDRMDARIWDAYDPGAALEPEVRSTERVAEKGVELVEFEITGVDGLRMPSMMMIPEDGGGERVAGEPWPCVIFLHGIGNDRRLLNQVGPVLAEAGFVSVSFDQFGRGERRQIKGGVVDQALKLRRRVQLTVLEARRMVDYLETRPEIDRDRIYLLGGSFGAMTGCVAAAQDARFRAVALVYGGGDFIQFRHSEEGQKELGIWTLPVAAGLDWLLSKADPVDYAGEISPRPVLLLAGKDDKLLPVEASRALAEAAREPKTVVWYEGDHVDKDNDLLIQIVHDTADWLRETDRQLVAGSMAGRLGP